MVFVYEDVFYKNLFPLTHLHPVFELRCGIFSPLERIRRLYKRSEVVLLVRRELEEITKEKYPNLAVNPVLLKKGLFISGRAILFQPIPEEGEEEIFTAQGDLVGFRTNLSNLRLFPLKPQTVAKQRLPTTEVKAFSFKNLWDLITLNEKTLPLDFPEGRIKGFLDKRAYVFGPLSRLYIEKKAKVFPGNCLNLETGNIYIDAEAKIMPFSYIEGPAYIGKRTLLFGAKIRPFSNIGEECRIGGEIESSIFLGFSNKYHEGFIGHSYIGEWVNLGAGTNNSDLKNNYSPVKVKIGKRQSKTSLIKLGCFIGDHAKTAISTLIPTGAVIGVFANVVQKGFSPNYIPNFYFRKGRLWKLKEVINTAKTVMKRRGVEMSENYERLIKKIYYRCIR